MIPLSGALSDQVPWGRSPQIMTGEEAFLPLSLVHGEWVTTLSLVASVLSHTKARAVAPLSPKMRMRGSFREYMLSKDELAASHRAEFPPHSRVCAR
jgi:hypothetical protein